MLIPTAKLKPEQTVATPTSVSPDIAAQTYMAIKYARATLEGLAALFQVGADPNFVFQG